MNTVVASAAWTSSGAVATPSTSARLWLACLIFGLVAAIATAFINPPLHAPDEPQHMYKAYRIGHGALWAEVQGRAAGGAVPSALAELTDRFVGNRDNWHGPREPQPLDATWSELARPLHPARQEFVDFTWTASYAPLPYAPQALAMAVGQLAGLGPLGLLYAGRVANAVASVLLVALAVALCPVARVALLLAGLLPMAVFEYGSLAPDGMIVASALLFTALSVRGEVRGRWIAAEIAGMAACGLVFCSIKIVYAPLLLIGLPAALDPARRRHTLLVHGIVLAVVLGLSLAWMRSTAYVLIQWAPGTDSAAQLQGILSDPISFAAVLARTLLHEGFFYRSMVAHLGWTQVWLPPAAYVLPALALIAAMAARLTDEPRLTTTSLAWKAALAVATAMLVMTALYLLWTPVGRDVVRGVQGRYFLPFAGLTALILTSSVRIPRHRAAPPFAIGIVAVMLLVTELVIVNTYDVF